MTAHAGNKRKVEDDEEDSTPPPPDGGWGWMVVFASFMIHIISKQFLFIKKQVIAKENKRIDACQNLIAIIQRIKMSKLELILKQYSKFISQDFNALIKQ